MKSLTKLTVTRSTLANTGFEYTVLYSPECGVDEIVSVYAIEKGKESIDVTLSMIHDFNLDLFIETVINWDEAYANQRRPSSPYFTIAAKAMLQSAK